MAPNLDPEQRREAANHVLRIMGPNSPEAKWLAWDILNEPDWTPQPPTEGGTYWWWNGENGVCPVPIFVSYSPTKLKTFVQLGQIGLCFPVACDDFGGWWRRLDAPLPPNR